MTDKTKPATFRERITTLSIKGIVTVGLDASVVALLFCGVGIPKELWYLVAGVNVWVAGADVLAVKK
jgi:hypothetical protein